MAYLAVCLRILGVMPANVFLMSDCLKMVYANTFLILTKVV